MRVLSWAILLALLASGFSQTETDHCDPNECVTGECISETEGFRCICTDIQYEGELCDQEVSEDDTFCERNLCENGGVCNDENKICDCSGTGFVGQFCHEDIDECLIGTNECADNAQCDNAPGSYSCTCLEGFVGDPFSSCTDLNECEENGLNPCPDDAVCINNVGSYECNCPPGYEYIKGEPTCVDIDECSQSGTCHQYANCTNEPGGYSCTCFEGLLGDGLNCIQNDPCGDEDTCREGTYCHEQPAMPYEKIHHTCIENTFIYGNCSAGKYLCDDHAYCEETPDKKAFKCICKGTVSQGNGFRATPEVGGTGCIYSFKPCKDNGTCSKFEHSYCKAVEDDIWRCECKDGFEGNGVICNDINECEEETDTCVENAKCLNTVGFFECICKLEENYEGNGFIKCTHFCSANSDCYKDDEVNLFKAECREKECFCRDGWEGPGNACTDVNECADDSLNDCNIQADCINLPGTYDCKCKNGFEGDGMDCRPLPRNCEEIDSPVYGVLYTVDFDFSGPANAVQVTCKLFEGVWATLLSPLVPKSDVPENGSIPIKYDAEPEDIQALLDLSPYCYQHIEFKCHKNYALMPGTTYQNAKGEEQRTWASKIDNNCACGDALVCDGCYCNGGQSGYKTDGGKIHDKSRLPVLNVQFADGPADKGTLTVGDLVCSSKRGIPKDCHDAKFNYNMKRNDFLMIWPEGASEPFIVYCDVRSYEHVGITEIPGSPNLIDTETLFGEIINYPGTPNFVEALIEGSGFCSQEIEFKCKNSKLVGTNGGYVTVTKESRRLSYFPGADSDNPDSCGCGVLDTCDSPSVKCNCNLDDGVERSDFGLVINKEDLPVVSVNAEAGGESSASYKIKPLRCAGRQFGIAVNCQGYKNSGETRDGEYQIDPDGPVNGNKGKLEPYLVECEFTNDPPQGKTIVHTNQGDEILVDIDVLPFDYKEADLPQIDGLKDRSTFCYQTIQVKCDGVLVENGTVTIDSPDEQTDLNSILRDACQANNQAVVEGILEEMNQVPVTSIDVSQVNQQDGDFSITLGPLICTEVFPTCKELKKFIDSSKSVLGEEKLKNGYYVIDPEGPLDPAKPFVVKCDFPKTTVESDTPDGDTLTPDPDNPDEPVEKCFDVTYKDKNGNPITPDQITALVKDAGNCRQDLKLQCQNSPATNMVNFTTCDGYTPPGWSQTFGAPGCTCGIAGVCYNPDQLCNCDANDDELRNDNGVITLEKHLGICQVCLKMSPSGPENPNEPPPPRVLKFDVSPLTCDGGLDGTNDCQRKTVWRRFRSIKEDYTEINTVSGTDFPVACNYVAGPPTIGELILVPKEPVVEPEDDGPINETIIYITPDFPTFVQLAKKEEFCIQLMFFFYAKGSSLSLNLSPEQGWYNPDGERVDKWEVLLADDELVLNACEQYPDLCDIYDVVGIRVTTDDSDLPVAGLNLPIQVKKVVVDTLRCYKLGTSCQYILDSRNSRLGHITKSYYTIDPDGAGRVAPMKVRCEFDKKKKIGTTIVEPDNQFFKKIVFPKDSNDNQDFSLPITYGSVDPEQIQALTKRSNFCHQFVKFECKYSELLGDNGAYYSLNDIPSSSVGTGELVEENACSCGITKTCTNPGSNCNCVATGGMGVDQGTISAKDRLPITNLFLPYNENSEIAVTVNELRCQKYPVDPPRTCADAANIKKRAGVSFSSSDQYLISPDPYNLDLTPFMVRCDFDTYDEPVTVLKPSIDPDTPVKNGEPVDVEYGGADPEQVRALIEASKFCYQGFSYKCTKAFLFAGSNNYWSTLGSSDQLKFFPGGDLPPDNDPSAISNCGCGKDNNCGGLDTRSDQLNRLCNCNAFDGRPREDAGILDVKKYLPLGTFSLRQGFPDDGAFLTLGDLICSDEELQLNPCELGFHGCHENAVCLFNKLENKHYCECKPGYQGQNFNRMPWDPVANGYECIDDDECSYNPCPSTSTCVNLPGSYQCVCNEGYYQIGNFECEDINECVENKYNCSEYAECRNRQGDYYCICKPGFRGDGVNNCEAVGECTCFGDPHCQSYDNVFSHYQGDCNYILSTDGCDGAVPTFTITADYWKNGLPESTYASWVKSVTVDFYDVVVTLGPGKKLVVDDVEINSYFHEYFTITRTADYIKVKAPSMDLEIEWDGIDMVNILVGEKQYNKVCGVCGNFNGLEEDEWTVGPACPNIAGQITESFQLFGNSWMVSSSTETCVADCDPEEMEDPDECMSGSLLVVNKSCNYMFDKDQSPFSLCLNEMDDALFDDLKYMCIYDVCHYPGDQNQALCEKAYAINKLCVSQYQKPTEGFQNKVIFCEDIYCEGDSVYLTDTKEVQETCVNVLMGTEPENENPEILRSGCYCRDGMVMEDGKDCVWPKDCGCLYNRQYIRAGEVITVSDCSYIVTCVGNNETETTGNECGDNQSCQLVDGTYGCFCEEGFIMGNNGECKVDDCYEVDCPYTNSECVEGECVCKMGYTGNCKFCQDINECELEDRPCNRLGETCVNTEGGFSCKCEPGFSRAWGLCTDDDECDLGNVCGAESECVNKPGTFICPCCDGYKKDAAGECVRDRSRPASELKQCCACGDDRCDKPGKVCGTDNKTYKNFKSLFRTACQDEREDLEFNYEGVCQGTCETVDCEGQFSTCDMVDGKPQCSCPTCEDSESTSESETVCASNFITYKSICEMQKDACTANLKTEVEVVFEGKPCPGGGEPFATPWSEWGDCSNPCGEGTMTRTRELLVENSQLSTEQSSECYSTCEDGPCTDDLCDPGEVCSINESNEPECKCPACEDVPFSPVCARVDNVILTINSECEVQKAACNNATDDFEILEDQACEDKPKECGKIRKYVKGEFEGGCSGLAFTNVGECYGGCDNTGETCCLPVEELMTIATNCGPRQLTVITDCECQPTPDGYVNNMAIELD